MYRKQYHIHFVGIGGIGMSGIAELLLNLGYRVSGSDISESDITRRLQNLGGKIFVGHSPENVEDADVVVTSSAISHDNAEVNAALAASVPVIPRAEMLAELMRLKYSVAVAGAHGKTSTTSMMAAVLEAGGMDPTVVIGGKLKSIGSNAVLGRGDFIVAEADESDGSFLKFSPTISVVTNIDLEHLDFYRDLEQIKQVFLEFIDRLPFYGLAVLCLDNEHLQDLIPEIKKRCITYGLSAQADFQAAALVFRGAKSGFSVYHQGVHLGDVSLNLPGRHNVANALAAIAVGHELEIPFETIRASLESLEGVQRRLEERSETGGIKIIDDYGHHPTEIKTTLEAIKTSWPDRRLVVVFQPHRYSRTRALFDGFARSFYQSDVLLVMPVYAANEPEIKGVDHNELCRAICAHGHKRAYAADDMEAALDQLEKILEQGDIVLTLGAGNVWQVGDALCERLSRK